MIFGPEVGDDMTGIGEGLPDYGDPTSPLLVTTHTGQVGVNNAQVGALHI